MSNKIAYVHLVYCKNDKFVDDYISKVLKDNVLGDLHLFLLNNMKLPYGMNYQGRYVSYDKLIKSHGTTFTQLVKDALKALGLNRFSSEYDFACIKDMDDIYFDSVASDVISELDSTKIGAVYFNEETVRGDKVSKEYGDLPDKEFTPIELAEWTTNNKGPVFMQRQFKFISKFVVNKINEFIETTHPDRYPSGNMGEDSLYTLNAMFACSELGLNIYCSNKVFGQYIRNSESSTLSLSNEERFMQFSEMHLNIIRWCYAAIPDDFTNRMILYRFLADRTKGQLTSYDYYNHK